MQDVSASTDSVQHRFCTKRFAATIIAWLAFAVLAVRITWPMPRDIAHELPLGMEDAATVPLFNLWTVWWNADRAADGLRDYWNAPIFHPTQRTFSFSEAQPTTIAVAPLVWITGTPVAAYNTYLLITLWLNGVCGYRLLRQRGFCWWPALSGGLLVETLPFVVWQLGVLQLTVLWASLWTIAALWRWSEQPRWTRAIEIGVAFGLTYLTCNYYGLFLALLLVPTAVGVCRRHIFTVRAWGHGALAVIMAGMLVAPVVLAQQHTSQLHGWKREMGNIIELSAHLRDYTNTPWPQWLNRWECPEEGRAGWALGPAWLQWCFAGAGLICGLYQQRWRGWTWFIISFGVLALVLSMGPRIEMWSVSPYRLLFKVVPGVAQIRSPFRFAVYVQLAVTWLAVIALQTLVPMVEDLGKLNWRQRGVLVVTWLPAILASAVMLLETRPINRSCYYWPEERWPQWVEYLREETPPETTIVHLPFAKGTDIHAYVPTTERMLWGTRHHRRMIDGYSGYFPDIYLHFKGALERFPATGAPQLAEAHIDLAIIDRRRIPPEHIVHTEPTSTWEWLFSDDVNAIDIYRIHPPPPPMPKPEDFVD